MTRPDYRLPTIDEIHQSTRKRTPEREAMALLYGNPFGFHRHPFYNNPYFNPEKPVVGSVRSVLDYQGKGLRVTDTLIAHETFEPLDAVMQRVMDLPLDLELVMRVYERLSTSRILSGTRLCAAVEVVTGEEDPRRISQAFIVYPTLYERSENKFVAPGVVGEQMALLHLQQI